MSVDNESLVPPPADKPQYTVEITRIGYGVRQIHVRAKDRKEAEELALEEAGNHLYDEHHADYEVGSSAAAIAVGHWSKHPTAGEPKHWQMDVEDKRKSSGQAWIDVGPIEGRADQVLGVMVEVGTDPETDYETPAVHVHFDCDNLAFSCFQQGDGLLLRLENDVELTQLTLQDGSKAYRLK